MREPPGFEYTRETRHGKSEPIIVRIEPLGAAYLAWRLKISTAKAERLHAQRIEEQRTGLINLVGEFVFDLMGCGGVSIQEAHIAALDAHRRSLSLEEQVYGGYRAWGFLWDGTLFGPNSSEAARNIGRTRRFSAAQVGPWRSQAGFANHNPFDHMTRGEDPKKSAPIVAGFCKAMLEAPPVSVGAGNAGLPPVDEDTAFWQPKDGLPIENTVQVVYHRGQV